MSDPSKSNPVGYADKLTYPNIVEAQDLPPLLGQDAIAIEPLEKALDIKIKDKDGDHFLSVGDVVKGHGRRTKLTEKDFKNGEQLFFALSDKTKKIFHIMEDYQVSGGQRMGPTLLILNTDPKEKSPSSFYILNDNTLNVLEIVNLETGETTPVMGNRSKESIMSQVYSKEVPCKNLDSDLRYLSVITGGLLLYTTLHTSFPDDMRKRESQYMLFERVTECHDSK